MAWIPARVPEENGVPEPGSRASGMATSEGVDTAMERVLRRIEERDLDGARREIDRMAERFGACPELSYVRGLLRLEEEDEESAFDLLVQAFRGDATLVDAGLTAFDLLADDDDPKLAVELGERLMDLDLTPEERADVVYRTARAHEDRGDERSSKALFLEVWDLDRKRRRRRGTPHASRVRFGKMVEEAIAQLPDPIRFRIESVPIVVQDRPDRDVVEGGFDPRALGMFDGVPYSDQGAPSLTRILIFQRNIEDSAEDEAGLEQEIYVTLLHETGHFFGLSEDDLERRGLA